MREMKRKMARRHLLFSPPLSSREKSRSTGSAIVVSGMVICVDGTCVVLREWLFGGMGTDMVCRETEISWICKVSREGWGCQAWHPSPS